MHIEGLPIITALPVLLSHPGTFLQDLWLERKYGVFFLSELFNVNHLVLLGFGSLPITRLISLVKVHWACSHGYQLVFLLLR
mmetsp:Transcript_3326/g.3298  ORF Transcript_3326/g.3298 Transcript_3326/m.3298 type:complete len:82 (-) Transcript_3326:131-376(-)